MNTWRIDIFLLPHVFNLFLVEAKTFRHLMMRFMCDIVFLAFIGFDVWVISESYVFCEVIFKDELILTVNTNNYF